MILFNFLILITRPKKALGQMLANPPSFWRIVIFLFIVSIIRGLLEVIWFYADRGLMSQLGYFLKSPSWHLFEFWRAIFSCVFIVYIRWLTYVFFVIVLSRAFGAASNVRMLLKFYGILLGVFALPIIVNFVYIIIPLPMIRFSVSNIHVHIIGIGQLVTAILFVFASTAIITTVQKIKRLDAFLISFAIPIVDRVVYVGGCLVFFKLPAIAKLNYRDAIFWESVVFILLSCLAIPILLRLARWFEERENRPKLGVLK